MKRIILLTFLAISISAQSLAPSLTKLEQKEIEVLTLKRQNLVLLEADLKRQQQALEKEITDFIAGIKATYPGYQLGENGQLVKLPEPPKPPDKK